MLLCGLRPVGFARSRAPVWLAPMLRRGSVERALGVGWGLGGVALRGVPLRDECQPSGGPRLALPGTGSRHPGRDDGVGCAGTAGQALPERRCHLVIPAGCRNPGPRRATSMLAPGYAWWDRNRVRTCGLPSLALGPGIRAGTTGLAVRGRRGRLCRSDGCTSSFRQSLPRTCSGDAGIQSHGRQHRCWHQGVRCWHRGGSR